MQVGRCEVCGRRAARYVCQECGRRVCERCLEPRVWVCLECYKRLQPEAPVAGASLWSVPFKLFFLGFLLTFVGVVLLMVSGFLSGDSAGFVWVLPFPPVVFGVGWPYSVWVIMLVIALTVVGIVLFVLLRKEVRRIWG